MKQVWDRIRGLLRIQRIRNRVLLAMITVSLPSLIILGVISFNITNDTILDINTRMTRDNLRTSSDMADLRFNMINNLNRAFVTDAGLRGELRKSNEGGKPTDIHAQMRRIMNSNAGSTTYVDSVCLVNLRFDIFCLGRSDNTGRYSAAEWRDMIQREDWFRRMNEAWGRTVYVGRNVIEDDGRTFSAVKLFRSADTIEGVPIGYLFLNISKKIFEDIFNTSQSDPRSVSVVLDMSGGRPELIYRSEAVPELDRTAETGDLSAVVRRMEEAGYNIAAYENARTRWLFLSLTEIDELLKDSYRIETYTIMILALIAVIAVILSYVISGGITTPLIRLKKLVIDWSSGKKIRPQTFGNDEIGVLGNTFQRVVFENQDLYDRLYHAYLKEREAELRALQAQINPHFLYNTLDSIYWMAMLSNHEKIARMAVSLSESFKLSLNKGRETILIANELKHIEHYMTIQNIRYNNRFIYVQDVDESLMPLEILKLILQPLVENAITHGLEPKIGEGTVRLTGYRDGDDLVFIVEDDGVGIGDMSMIENGYGLRNVRERLRLYYGESGRFEIVSAKDKGTTVTLRFNPDLRERGHRDESRDH